MTKPNKLHLHEEVLLLALKDDKGTPFATTQYGFAMAGAMVAELVLAERIDLEDSKR
jgi:hypothetical protein